MRRLAAACRRSPHARALATALRRHAAAFDPVVPGHALEFPRDFGAHPGFRIEWWYVTGQLDAASGPIGFQVTFFRVRNPGATNPTRAASARARSCSPTPRYPIPRAAACCTASAPSASSRGWSRHRSGDTDVRLDDWTFAREAGVLPRACRGRGLRARPRLHPDAARAARGRPRLQPQGPARRAGELLLQRAAARGRGRASLETARRSR